MTNPLKSTPRLLAWLTVPTLAASLLLSSCSNDPKATDPDNTATVVENPDVKPVTADSAATNTAPAH